MAEQPLPAKVSLKLYRGDTRVWQDTFRHEPVPPATIGNPVDLTGYEFLCQIRTTQDDASVLATIAVDMTDPENGLIRRTLTAEEADKLDGRSAFWDLQATLPDGTVRTFVTGNVTIVPDVSRG